MKQFLKVGGKAVGLFDDKAKVFEKRVQEKKHRLWKHNAYGIQLDVLNKLKELDCKVVIIKELDTDITYRSQFHQWIQSTLQEDLGHGVQKFLGIGEMLKFHGLPAES